MNQPRAMILAGALVAGLWWPPVSAAPYGLAIQIAMPAAMTERLYQPLADYLSTRTGERFQIQATGNFLTHWNTMRRPDGGYQFVMDAAHFTAYRAEKMGYRVLAAMPGRLSFTIVTSGERLVLEAAELVGRPVAALAPPSLGSMLLEQAFPDPIRRPRLLEVADVDAAVARLRDGTVHAAVIPTLTVARFPDLNVVETTAQFPAVAISAAPGVPAEVAEAVRRALVTATETPAGRAMLEAINIEGFDEVTAADYQGYDRLLEGTWGY